VDKTPVYIGDKIKYSITVKAPKEFEVQLPEFGDNLAEFKIKDFGSSEGGIFGRTFLQWYILDTYETGILTIPEAAVKYRGKGVEEWREITTDEIKVEVLSLLNEAEAGAGIRDIKGPRSLYDLRYVYIALSVLAAVIIIIILAIYYKKRKMAKESVIPPRPAHEIALEALTELKHGNLVKEGMIKEYYFELSDIVRHYLENRFSLKAPEMTTEEFLSHVRQTAVLRSDHKSLLREFLSHCDMVKFAKYFPAEKEIASSFESAMNLVEQTKDMAEGVSHT
jgi:hypothetical protein